MKKIKSIKNKKQGFTMLEMIAAWVILLISVAIIFFIAKQILPTNSDTARQTCAASVAVRSAASFGTLNVEFRDVVQLQCTTEKICLVSGNSAGCSELGKDYKKIQVNGDKQKILEAIGQNIYDWHITLGSGTKNFMPRGFFENKYCLRNSFVYFDKNTQDELIKNKKTITYYDLYAWMFNKKTSDGTSYLEKVYGGNKLENILVTNRIPIDPSKGYIVFASMTEVGKWGQYVSAGVATATVVLGVLSIPLTGGLSGAAIFTAIRLIPVALSGGAVVGGATWVMTGTSSNDAKTFVYESPQLIVFDDKTLASLDCSEWEMIG